MNLIQLERIVMVAKAGSFSDVAQKLYISQPALSQTIANVEEEVGAVLFDRSVQPIMLTPEGEVFLRAAQEILRTNQLMRQDLQTVRSGARGRITIGSSIPRCQSVWAHVLPQMTSQYPDVTLGFIDGKSSEFERMIAHGNINFALSNSPPNSNRIGSYILNAEKYLLVANRSSDFARKMDAQRSNPAAPVRLEKFQDERFILLDPQRNSRLAFNQMIRESGIRPHIAIEVYNSNLALEYVKANLGVALIPIVMQSDQAFSYQTEDLSYYEIDSKYASRTLYLYYDAEISFNYAQQFLVDLVLEKFSSLSE